MTKDEVYELAKEFVTPTTEVLFGTSDGNIFYHKHFATNHSRAFNHELYEFNFKVEATPEAPKKPKKTSRKR